MPTATAFTTDTKKTATSAHATIFEITEWQGAKATGSKHRNSMYGNSDIATTLQCCNSHSNNSPYMANGEQTFYPPQELESTMDGA